MIHHWYRSISHLCCLCRLDKKTTYKHSSIWHHSVLSLAQLSAILSYHGQSRFWQQSHSILLQLPDQQTYSIHLEPVHFTTFQYRYQSWPRIFFVPYSLCPLCGSPISHIQKKNHESFYTCLSSLFCWWQFICFSGEKLKSNSILQSSYSIISSLFENFGLIIEHDKSEVFHFSRATKKSEPPPLDLSPAGSSILNPKDVWQYLRFFFDKKLSFRYHTHYYANKAISTIKSMKMLGNSTRGLSSVHKHLLYRTCVLPITLYGLQLWYFKGAPTFYLLKELKKMQWRAAL